MGASGLNVGPAAGPPPGPPPGASPFVGPVQAIKDDLRLADDIYRMLAQAFASVNYPLQEHEQPDPYGFNEKPMHYRALPPTGEVVLLQVAKQIIEDSAISPGCLHQVVVPFLTDAAGLFIFTEAQALSAPYQSLLSMWQKLGQRIRRVNFILHPQIQQLKAADGKTLIQEVKELLCLEQVIGSLDEMSDEDKRYIAGVIAELADASNTGLDYLKTLIKGLQLDGRELYYLALGSFDGQKNLLNAGRELVTFCQNTSYPKNDPRHQGYTMLGRLLLTISEERGDEALIRLIAKYRLITNQAAVEKLELDYRNIDF